MLILFDIDATLLTTSRAGMYAMLDAGRALHGESFEIHSTEFAGRLDPLIIHDLLVNNGIEPDAVHCDAMRRGYREHLERRLAQPGVARALPGVGELLEVIRARSEVTLGVLTGNFGDTGRMKLWAAGIDPEQFAVQVWGDESPHTPACRDHLPPIAIERYRRLLNGHTDASSSSLASRTTIVGDTPHDVRCALASGCRVLGVATGSYKSEEIERAGAHRVVESLGDTTEVVDWLLR